MDGGCFAAESIIVYRITAFRNISSIDFPGDFLHNKCDGGIIDESNAVDKRSGPIGQVPGVLEKHGTDSSRDGAKYRTDAGTAVSGTV